MHVCEHLADRFRRDGLNTTQRDGFSDKHAYGPLVVAIRNRGARDGDHMGGLLTGQSLALALVLLVMQNRFESAREIPLPHTDGGIAGDAEHLAHLGISPALGGFEQRMCPCEGPCVGFACMEKGLERSTIFFGEGNRNGMLHGTRSVVFLPSLTPVHFGLD